MLVCGSYLMEKDMIERFADIEILRYELTGFDKLSLREKRLVYCLSQATLWGRDITFDQYGRCNLRIRKLLEAIYTYYGGEARDDEYSEFLVYLKRICFSNGIHHHYSGMKIQPEFSQEYFVRILKAIPSSEIPFLKDNDIDALLAEVLPVMFDESIMPQRVNHADGDDLVATSACNYYEGVTDEEVLAFYDEKKRCDDKPSWGLNSRLAKKDGALHEETYKIGGRYSASIERIVYWLTEAQKYADDDRQKQVIGLLTEYYSTGDLSVFDEYSISWVTQTDTVVDFINGFIEVYGDPLGIKGTWEGIVHYKDVEATQRTQTLCQNAQWFEDNSPVDVRFKKGVVKGVTANVVRAAMLGGEEYPSTAIGINLPNADWIREQHGSKSITISNITAAYNEASKGNGFRQEYIDDEEVLKLIDQYGHLTDDLHTDLHECLGHGSGCMLPGISADALKSYASAIEEARADLFGLYYMADAKLVELGLLPDTEAYKAQYYTYMLNGLMTQCVRIPLGEDIQEAHMRNRALIANWVYERAGDAMKLEHVGEKTYLRISDFHRLRTLIGTLLAEVQRIKSEGDFDAARRIVEDYGVKIPRTLHEEVLSRYKRLNIAPYKGFLNPWLKEVADSSGCVVDVAVCMDETYMEQMMRYSREYSAE